MGLPLARQRHGKLCTPPYEGARDTAYKHVPCCSVDDSPLVHKTRRARPGPTCLTAILRAAALQAIPQANLEVLATPELVLEGPPAGCSSRHLLVRQQCRAQLRQDA